MKFLFTTVTIVIMLTTSQIFAQGFKGIAYYQTKTTIDIDFANTRIPPDRVERIKEMMKRQGERVYELSFTGSESIYKEEEQLDQPGNGGGGGRMRFFGGMASGKTYKNTETKDYYQEQNLMGKDFLISDILQDHKWEMKDETKMIGQYLCFKAVTTQTVNVNNFRFGRPPPTEDEKKEENEDTKEIQVIAWYTVDIPINQGPAKYWGLPGLILEISAGNVQIVCNKITINPKDKIDIKTPSKGKKVTQEEYDEIRNEKMKEMRENRGRNNDRGGRPRQ